jgi:hypothetical protein
MKNHPYDPSNDLEAISSMMLKGRQAAAFDGKHMCLWGGFSALALGVQYFAEVGDWLPSSVLWLWQPVLLLIICVTLYRGRHSLMHRLRNPVVRTYSAAFSAAALTLLVYALSGLSGGLPDAHTFSVLLSGVMASAFFVMAIVTNIARLLMASVGWFGGAGYFGYKGELQPYDFLVLSGLFFVFVVLPGIYLSARSSRTAATQLSGFANEA